MFDSEISSTSPEAENDRAWPSHRPDGLLRDQDCVFPGCEDGAGRYDVDFRVPVGSESAFDPPVEVDLWPLCWAHYRLKQQPGWSLSRHPSGTVIWRTPSGHHYIRRPSRFSRSVRSPITSDDPRPC